MKVHFDRRFQQALRAATAEKAGGGPEKSGFVTHAKWMAGGFSAAVAALAAYTLLADVLSVDTALSALLAISVTCGLSILYAVFSQSGAARGDGSVPPGEAGLMTSLLRAMPAAIAIKDPSGRYVGINELFQDWFEFPDAEACLGHTVDELFPAELSDAIQALDRQVMEDGGVAEHEFSYRRADGSLHWILSRRFRICDSAARVIAVAAVNIDITDSVSAREEIADLLRQREEQSAIFRGFFDEFPFPAGLRKPDGEMILVNPVAVDWFGMPSDEMVGKKAEDFLPPGVAARSKALDLSVAETRVADTYETRMDCADGKTRDMLITRFPLLSDDGELLGLGAFNIDVTEQRTVERLLRDMNSELEALVEERTRELQVANGELKRALDEVRETTQKLIDSEKLASLAPMVAGVAHEINTPIGTGVTASSLIRDKVLMLREQVLSGQLTRSALEEAVSNIDESSTILLKNLERANRLIRSFKQISADQSGPADREFALCEHLEQVLLTLAPRLRRARLTVALDCAADLVLESDPGALTQVITNLLMNVVEHAYADDIAGAANIQVTQTGEKTRIRVRDGGRGIEPAHLKEIFVPFFTTRRAEGGTGLGLSIVYNTVTANLKGEISCESTPGEGTVFTIDLPNRVSPRTHDVHGNAV